MALSDPKDTLAFHLSRPLSRSRDMSGVSLPDVMERYHAFCGAYDQSAIPETEALTFYGMNACMAEIQKTFALYEPLGDVNPMVNDIYARLSQSAARAFYYLLIICTRESRHVHKSDVMYEAMTSQFGPTVTAFNITLKGSNASAKLKSGPPKIELGRFVSSLRWVFYNGKFNGGFGGPAWGQVADCLENFVYGKYTAEMMLDTVWTLSHNNGPIFNKGELYHMYNPAAILRLLDVQRSGQIPEFILANELASYVHEYLRDAMKWLKTRFPNAVGDYVDWFAVQHLGALGNYQAEQQAQLATHGPSTFAEQAKKKAEKEQAAKAALAAEKLAQQQAEKDQKFFTIMPGVDVKKIKRAA